MKRRLHLHSTFSNRRRIILQKIKPITPLDDEPAKGMNGDTAYLATFPMTENGTSVLGKSKSLPVRIPTSRFTEPMAFP